MNKQKCICVMALVISLFLVWAFAGETIAASEKRWSRDLRGWMECLKAEGELKTVEAKVTPDGEIQEIARQMSARKGPAVLFTNIAGHEKTWCTKLIVGSQNTFSKVSLALGLPKNTPLPVLIKKLRETLQNPVPPIIVDTGPVKQNIIKTGIDLNKIPVPIWHPGDGGRYINTWQGVVTKDPETGVLNVGIYRGMIAGKDTITSLLIRSQHWGQHFVKYSKKGEKMPVAFIYGTDPTFMIAAGSPETTSGK
jgi:UbiD family decarboxylase